MRRAIKVLLENVITELTVHKETLQLFLGYTANLDRVISLTDARVAELLNAIDQAVLLQRIDTASYYEIRDPVDFWRSLWVQISAGKGGEWPLQDATTYRWLCDTFSRGRPGVGGTGAQAAGVLAALGLRPLVNLPLRDRRLLELLPDNVQKPAAPDGCATTHLIFEYPQGFTMTVNGRTATAPKHDRLIIPYDPERKEFTIGQDFWHRSVAQRGPKALLISGYNVPGNAPVILAALAQTEAHLRVFGRRNTLIQLEMGESHLEAARQALINRLFRRVHSVSLNENELAVLAEDLGEDCADSYDIQRVVTFCQGVVERFGLKRLNLHTAHYALAVSEFPVTLELAAMAFGNAVAAYRAMHITGGGLEELKTMIKPLALNRQGQEICRRADLASSLSIDGHHNVALLPTFELTKQQRAVGLGDSYTAGVLAVHALAMHRGVLPC